MFHRAPYVSLRTFLAGGNEMRQSGMLLLRLPRVSPPFARDHVDTLPRPPAPGLLCGSKVRYRGKRSTVTLHGSGFSVRGSLIIGRMVEASMCLTVANPTPSKCGYLIIILNEIPPDTELRVELFFLSYPMR